MCDICVKINHTIARYRRVTRSINDVLTIESAQALIADLEAQKVNFHPAQTK
jgi:hypothetical protein